MKLIRTAIRTRPQPRGAAALETAFVLPVTLLVVFALLDLGLAALRYNTLVDASQRLAREAAMHGDLAPSVAGSWGPATYTGTAADADKIMNPIRQHLPTMAADLVAVELTWPDTGNSPRDRIEVGLRYQHQPLLPVFPWGTLDLQSTTTMRIVN